MKIMFNILFHFFKAIAILSTILIGIGWSSFVAIDTLTTSKVKAATEQLKEIRSNDMEHINKRFDETQALIRELKHGGH